MKRSKQNIIFLQVKLLFFCLSSIAAHSQCLTDLRKIYPDRGEAQLPDDLRIASCEKFMIVTSFRNDTTGFANAGAGFLFEQTIAGWVNIALLKPSDAHTNLAFGESVSIDSLGETIVIGAAGGEFDNSNSIYVFHKPSTGWVSMTQTEKLQFDAANYLLPVKVSTDGLTLIGSTDDIAQDRHF